MLPLRRPGRFARRAGISTVAAAALAMTTAALAWQPSAAERDAAQPETPSPAIPANPLRNGAAAQRLPWERRQSSSPLTRARPLDGPREFLARYGISDSQWDGLADGQELRPAEQELLIRLLSLYGRMGQENVESWAVDDLTWDQLAASAAEQRGQIVRVSGRVQHVAEVKLPAETAGRYEFSRYFRVSLKIAEAPYAAVLFCREVPAAWGLDAPLNEQASAYGLFLKIGDAAAEPTPLLMATGRIAWHPAEPRPDLNVHAGHVALAGLGVDIGRFQEVGKERAIGLLAVDREPFYQTLAALGSAKELPAQDGALDLVQLLQQPQANQGQVLPVRGLARRVARVEVPDPDIRRRFGIDHYFEVDLAIPLEQTIRLGADPKNKQQAVVYENRFPATICVRELPAGLAVGDDVRQVVEAPAVFFKIWLYHSPYTRRADLPQPAPLFLARTVRVAPRPEQSTFWSDVVVGSAMALAAAAFVGIFLWFRWSDRAARPLVEAPPAEPDFSDLR